MFEDGDFVLFLGPDSFEEITAEMSEAVSLVSTDPNYEPVITLAGTVGVVPPFEDGDWATFEISEDGLTLTIIPATVWLDAWNPADPLAETAMEAFYVYREGEYVISYVEGLVEDAAGNENAAGSFTLTYVDLTTVITLLEIPGIAAPVIGGTPDTTAIDSPQYTGEITWDTADVFAGGTTRIATITLVAKTGFTLIGVEVDSFLVTGAVAENAVNTGVVTATFTM
ncbi:hypothetical protein ES708_33935 [subsurface metagenome]